MGEREVEEDQPKPSILRSVRRRVTRLLLPELDDAVRHYDETVLRLKRMTQQRNQLSKDVGLYKGQQWGYLAVGDMNPDLIDFGEYAKMMKDAQVRAGFDLIEMGTLMKPWKIRHPDEEVVDTLTRNFETLIYPNMRAAMKEMLSAMRRTMA